jgi:hypothetical protein
MTSRACHASKGRELETAWMADAACTRMPGLPWIENRQQVPRVIVDLMREICAGCPVLAECADFVVDAEITAGWWAGASYDGYTVQDLPRREDHAA